ncbi:ankyrin repeat domain-containing protein [Akkermansiaceae bacterium]|nr:ankyrin repeat domain-containing protein [Akkermansiaceae bacterium]
MKITIPIIASIVVVISLVGCNKSSSSLEVAAMTGDIDSVKAQIDAGADVNLPADKPPLYTATAFAGDLLRDPRPDMQAREKSYTKIVELLVSAGADLDAQDSAGDAALARAARSGHKEIVQLLISKGADVNLMLYSGRTQTALDRAMSAGEPETAALLRKHGGKTRAELEASESGPRD